jgi:hypothetical protein
MATVLLSAAGAAIGSGFGGTVLGLSGAVIGRAVGATVGRTIDQRLLGGGADAVEVGRVDRFRIMGASEGAAVARVWGRARIAGQVIWATQFAETENTTGGGKSTSGPEVTEYSYSVSLAIALCEGTILGIGRVWADGVEIPRSRLNMRVHRGSENQTPDPKIEAVEGTGQAPAYRGVAYVVLEDLPLGQFGNRVPQFSFEVLRRAQGQKANEISKMSSAVRAVAMIPGTGEYSLATTAVHYEDDPGVAVSANVHTPANQSDLTESLTQLNRELPGCGAVSLVVSWFGDDLRCGNCQVQPKVEQADREGVGMPWEVCGTMRDEAEVVLRFEERSIYGGTPADRSVIEAIQSIKSRGKEVMFYPFILMDQWRDNGLSNPWDGAPNQPVLPWRGRITLSSAPGQPGTPDRTESASAQVAAFFGTAQPSDFSLQNNKVVYTGPNEWRYRRFILHYAHLCALAGGVDAFCIGTEMVALTQIRGAGDSFPAVSALVQLIGEVRAILGPDVKLTYAADWSEYFGYHADGNVYFHLDPIWADPQIDFIGIDNYMPISDWRDGEEHADASWGSVYNLDYLKSNIAGGEGYDWYYDSPEGEQSQRRKPIEDGAYSEPWVFRYKDLRNWWGNPHHNRVNGIRQAQPTAWVPASKPIWFTEYGCAAVDKGTNQPNKFLDPKSSESLLPKFSNGRRDDLIQMQYLRAFEEYWADPAVNPASHLYSGPMVDMSHAFVWTWDARPFPYFPSDLDTWGDGENYPRGHWITGRATNQPLAAVVAEICHKADVAKFDVSQLFGAVRGYWVQEVATGRAALQPLMLAYGFDAVEKDGVLHFKMRHGRVDHKLDTDDLALHGDLEGALVARREAEAETAGRVRLTFAEAEGSYEIRHAEAAFPDEKEATVAQTELPLVLTSAEGRGITERWLAEARVARDTARLSLPRSVLNVGAGDVIALEGQRYRVDRVEIAEAQVLDAVRVEPASYTPSDSADESIVLRPFVAPLPVYPLLMDLPLLSEDNVPHAPYIAVTSRPWPGTVAVWSSSEDEGYRLNSRISRRAVIGRTESALAAARSGMWDRGAPLRVRLFAGSLSSSSLARVLNGENAIAIGDGLGGDWEILQFATAELVAPRTYDLSMRLRGQLGTDAIMPSVWPIGSRVVLLNAAVRQLKMNEGVRGLIRHYRVGVAERGFDDPTAKHLVQAFDGVGLRPYAPVHLSAQPLSGGAVRLRWIRRSRLNGDAWIAREIPLGEAAEEYLVRIVSGGQVRREVSVSERKWDYGAAERLADSAFGPIQAFVAQVSESFGPGPFRQISLSGL